MKTLAYHSIEECLVKETGAELYCVSVASFREQMEFVSKAIRMADSRWQMADGKDRLQMSAKKMADTSVGLQSANCNLQSGNNLQSEICNLQSVKLTFDDGDVTNYKYAYPVLKEFKLRAYFFILVGRVGTAGYMSWEHIKELKDNGMIIGSHGMTHRLLTELNREDLISELQGSKNILEEKLSCSIDSFSVPRGFHSKKIIEQVKEAGYKTIFTSDNRIAVKADWDLAHFERVLCKGYSFKEKTRMFIANASKCVLGPSLYDKVRSMLLR